ncbi:MAG: hypothetical protein Q9198_009892 [Flavoplaca austrocitrina]
MVITAKVEDSITDYKHVLLSSLQDTAIVTVRVGSGEEVKSWAVHKGLLTHHSPFFAAALNGFFKESTSNVVELIEDSPEAFNLFVYWLYTGDLTPGKLTSDVKRFARIACLAWALGDKLQCPVFQDRAMLQLLAFHKHAWLMEDAIRLIYNVSPSGSKLRSFAADIVCYHQLGDQRLGIGVDGIMAVEDLTRDVLEKLVKFDRMEGGEDPCDEGSSYLKVLAFEKCKVEKDME